MKRRIITEINKFSQSGEKHIKSNMENEDALCSIKDSNSCVISLCDGVSQCSMAKDGANITCEAVSKLLCKKGKLFFDFPKDIIAKNILSHILYEIRKEATKASKDTDDYSSTFASVLWDRKKDRIMCIGLGDSIVIAVGKQKCRVVLEPCESFDGCVVTTTKGALEYVNIKIFDAKDIESVIILSDGAWRAIFEKNRMNEDAQTYIKNNNYELLVDCLKKKKIYDDYSFISLDIRDKNRRKQWVTVSI